MENLKIQLLLILYGDYSKKMAFVHMLKTISYIHILLLETARELIILVKKKNVSLKTTILNWQLHWDFLSPPYPTKC